jgi:DNA-binding NarL/FixJ family response regulator
VKGRILVADDDLLFLSTMEQALISAGHSVRPVSDAAGVLAALADAPFDVVVADIHMPGNEKLELLQAKELERRQVSIVLVTGQATVDTAVGALNHSAAAYLRKPFKPNELFEAVGRALRQVRQRQLLARLRVQNQQISEMIETLEASPRAESEQVGHLTEQERESISAREHEVLELIATGLETTEVARKLFISPYTVRNHMKAIYKKLGVNSHAALVFRLLAPPS